MSSNTDTLESNDNHTIFTPTNTNYENTNVNYCSTNFLKNLKIDCELCDNCCGEFLAHLYLYLFY